MRRTGFTLIEVLVALVIFAIGALGLAAEMATLTRTMGVGQRASIVTGVAAARLEALRAEACQSRSDDQETIRHHSVALAELRWSWRDQNDSIYRLSLTTVPLGPWTPVPPDTLTSVIWCRR